MFWKALMHWFRKAEPASKPILIDREGVAYNPSRRVVLKAKS